MATGRIRERNVVIPALRAAAARGNGHIPTSELINELTAEFQPEGEDAEILDGRSDSKFSQIVRNIISHRDTAGSIFSRGYAVYENDGISVTDAGRKFLAQVPE